MPFKLVCWQVSLILNCLTCPFCWPILIPAEIFIVTPWNLAYICFWVCFGAVLAPFILVLLILLLVASPLAFSFFALLFVVFVVIMLNTGIILLPCLIIAWAMGMMFFGFLLILGVCIGIGYVIDQYPKQGWTWADFYINWAKSFYTSMSNAITGTSWARIQLFD